MTTLLEILFWLSIAVILYAYIGYGMLVAGLNGLRRLRNGYTKRISQDEEFALPTVSLIVAAYNEAELIEAKIKNSLSLNYPADLLEVIIISDGSTDQTPEIVSNYASGIITPMHAARRDGKTAAVNRAVKHALGEVLIFSDANTMLNADAIRNIVKHYANPRVGAVAGEKRVLSNGNGTAVAEEGLYWKYESFLKKQDAQFYTVVGAAGELFSIRSSLYIPVPENIILDDFYVSLSVCRNGYMVKYAADAFGEELPSANVKEEKKRKVRIAAGGFQAMQIFADLMNPLRDARLAFQYVSHRVLRWAVCPFLLLVALVTNAWLAITANSDVYSVLLICQVLFYSMAAAGAVLQQKGVKVRLLNVPFYFTFMNWSVYLGLYKFLSKQQSAVWERSARSRQLAVR